MRHTDFRLSLSRQGRRRAADGGQQGQSGDAGDQAGAASGRGGRGHDGFQATHGGSPPRAGEGQGGRLRTGAVPQGLDQGLRIDASDLGRGVAEGQGVAGFLPRPVPPRADHGDDGIEGQQDGGEFLEPQQAMIAALQMRQFMPDDGVCGVRREAFRQDQARAPQSGQQGFGGLRADHGRRCGDAQRCGGPRHLPLDHGIRRPCFAQDEGQTHRAQRQADGPEADQRGCGPEHDESQQTEIGRDIRCPDGGRRCIDHRGSRDRHESRNRHLPDRGGRQQQDRARQNRRQAQDQSRAPDPVSQRRITAPRLDQRSCREGERRHGDGQAHR